MQLQIHIWVVLFDLNLGSTPAWVPSVSPELIVVVVVVRGVHSDPSSDPISISPELMLGGLTPDLDPAPDPYFSCTF